MQKFAIYSICVSDLNTRSQVTRLVSAAFAFVVTRGLELPLPIRSACNLSCSNLGGAPRSIWTAGHGKGLKVAAIGAGAVPLSAPPTMARSSSCCTFAKNLRPGRTRMQSAHATELHARGAAFGKANQMPHCSMAWQGRAASWHHVLPLILMNILNR